MYITNEEARKMIIAHECHKEYKYQGKPIIVDACEISEGMYEVMAMYAKTGIELDCMRTSDPNEAVDCFKRFTLNYIESEALTGKYLKLRNDLIKAVDIRERAELEYMCAHGNGDGGTCNFDAPTLLLPRWHKGKVEQAAREAGSSCFSWDGYGYKRYVFRPHTSCQGNGRTVNAEAMQKALEAMGYNAGMYYQMD